MDIIGEIEARLVALEAERYTRGYGAETIYVGGKAFTVKPIPRVEVIRWFRDFKAIVRSIAYSNPSNEGQALALALLENHEVYFNLMRAVRERAGQPYVGREALGKELVLDQVRAKDVGLTTWEVSYAATGENTMTTITTDEYVGIGYSAYYNPLAEETIDAVKVLKEGAEFTRKAVDFKKEKVVIEPIPVITPPESTTTIKVNAIAAAADHTRLVGLIVATADKLRTL